MASARISLCHCLTLCFGGRSATEQLSGIINVFSPEDSTGENKQEEQACWRADLAFLTTVTTSRSFRYVLSVVSSSLAMK